MCSPCPVSVSESVSFPGLNGLRDRLLSVKIVLGALGQVRKGAEVAKAYSRSLKSLISSNMLDNTSKLLVIEFRKL